MRIDFDELMSPERRARGYVIVLPGIEGRSRWNRRIVQGLLLAGTDSAIEIHDWTFGRIWAVRSLRSRRRHQQQARIIAEKILTYRHDYPQRPVYLIGHSGGGAMTILTLEKLSEEHPATGGILLGAAISPEYDLAPALRNTERGIWSFTSPRDSFFLKFGTRLLGTLDGKRTASAGAVGMRQPLPKADQGNHQGPRYVEIPWTPRLKTYGHNGGHFGYVHADFVRAWIAPIVQGGTVPSHSERRPSQV